MALSICGVDEAGRGPLAGPLTAAAVVLPRGFPLHILGDSKKLSAQQRTRASVVIRCRAIDYAISWVWPGEIDTLNIHRAALVAMERAVFALSELPDIVLVDGRFTPCLPTPTRAVVRGDGRVRAIQAASILAKVARDLWMERYARIEPAYGFEVHKGYPTKAHRAALAQCGPSPIHRRSFRLTASE